MWYALSVKQPWAALLAAGVKTVEVRTWPTARRGRLLIHAGKVPDDRPEAWAWVTTPELRAAAELRGGVVGVGELTGCIAYQTRTAFEADRGRHLNLPDWFVEGGLYGFAFRDLRPVAFVPCVGNTFFFPVEGFDDPFSPLPAGERGRG
ncbi:MAG TPA: ASCH domain-containing protein [Fimbriiglobus sp.]|nr:ASCH domain-containing protein [Fimbriiglobus sp.]